ncbi:GNAT family acetyltransferase [uncultured Methylobacterium sp.]|jgi:ribosomal protein S18 acetylase RimI-like enzyme|uniref:GNAT family acetyltransferase n=1 Tax=uncultured Methylobacterium sp. TaxID=157278 RepID=UPI002610FF8F|nr:GNAT family acetyltransferase [uncultured Methylobacterium sp.]
MTTITPYRDHHYAGVASLWAEAFPDDSPWNRPEVAIPEKMRFQPDLFFVALEEDAVVGSVMAGYEGHRGWISRIAVLKAFRGKGLGRRLLDHAEARLAALGCIKVNLQVVASNAATAEFYARSGYAVEARISMSKRLGG